MYPPSSLPTIVAMLSLASAPSGIGQSTEAATRTFTLIGAAEVQFAELPKEPRAIRVTPDAHIFIRVRVNRILDGDAPWKEGTRVAFLVHSTKSLLGHPLINGEQYRFTFAVQEGPVADGDCRYCITDLASVRSDKK